MSEDKKNEAALKLLQYLKRTISEEVYQQLNEDFESRLRDPKPKQNDLSRGYGIIRKNTKYYFNLDSKR